MLIILVKEVCTLCNGYLRVLCETWLRHLSNCISRTRLVFTIHWAISLFVKVVGLACETRAYITSLKIFHWVWD